jgi:hypothetical protein
MVAAEVRRVTWIGVTVGFCFALISTELAPAHWADWSLPQEEGKTAPGESPGH